MLEYSLGSYLARMLGVQIRTSALEALLSCKSDYAFSRQRTSLRLGSHFEPLSTRVPPLQRQPSISHAAVQQFSVKSLRVPMCCVGGRSADVRTHIKADIEHLAHLRSSRDPQIAGRKTNEVGDILVRDIHTLGSASCSYR